MVHGSAEVPGVHSTLLPDKHWTHHQANTEKGHHHHRPKEYERRPVFSWNQKDSNYQFYNVQQGQFLEQQEEEVCFLQTHNQGLHQLFLTVSPRPPHLAQHTWWRPCFYAVPEATHEASWGPLKGTRGFFWAPITASPRQWIPGKLSFRVFKLSFCVFKLSFSIFKLSFHKNFMRELLNWVMNCRKRRPF